MAGDKSTLRKQAMQQRRLLTQTERARHSALICQALINHFAWAELSCVHVYIPWLDRMEVNIWPFLNYLFAHQSHITVLTSRLHQEQLDCLVIDAQTKYILNRFGIAEPDQQAALVEPEKIELMILPLLACDQQGQRLGYGKGDYDRLLARCRSNVKKIGVHYFAPIADTFPEAHDIPLTGLMTAEQYFAF